MKGFVINKVRKLENDNRIKNGKKSLIFSFDNSKFLRMLKEKIHIGKVGNIDVKIEVLKLNPNKKPKIAIVTGIHGDETSGLIVIHRLLQRIHLFEGQLSILLFSNPLATIMERRVGLDFLDLNRILPGKEDGTITERIAWKLSEFLLEQDFVIDLHTFDIITPVMGIFMNVGSKNVRKINLEMLKAFSPDIVWNLKVKGKEKHFFNSLGPFLARRGIPNFAVEMNKIDLISDSEIEKIVEGILNVFRKLKLIPGESNSKSILVLDRKEIRSEKAGIFIPVEFPPKPIKKGHVIGVFIDTCNFSTHNVIANEDGILIQISPKKLVKTGDLIFSIGKKSNEWR
ncbi:MAG: succinylglutamate desuccinylase/aspartoacylase family protein [Candidatus Aenigmatarchaeota archaeon]